MLRGCLHALRSIGVAVINDLTVPDTNDAVGIFICQFRIVGNHDHQTVPGHFLQQIHDLHAGFAVQRAGGLVCQQNIRIVYQSSGNGHTLHLSTGHLIWLLMELITQAHILQSLHSPLAALTMRNAGNGQSQFHIGKYRLVGNQIIALKHKANGMVTIGVPIPVGIFLGGNAVDNQITAVVAIQTANDIEQRGLTGTAGAQNGHELIVPQGQAHAVQRYLNQISGHIFLSNVLDLQHSNTPMVSK